jgi:hypothetical protein
MNEPDPCQRLDLLINDSLAQKDGECASKSLNLNKSRELCQVGDAEVQTVDS